jgi:hypothetical protein
MNQNIWGPQMWFTLHSITFNYPLKPTEEDKNNYKNFFTYLQYVIPCTVCQKNYVRHLKESPVEYNLNSREKLVKWLIDLHNMVNGETGKKLLSYNNVIKKYEQAYQVKDLLNIDNQEKNAINKEVINAESVKIANKFLIKIIGIVLVLFLIFYILKRWK